MHYSKERADGYIFSFAKYILNYETDATLEIKVGFDGKIVYIRDATDIFDGIDINVTSDWIDEKVQKTLADYEEGTAEIESVRIGVEDGTPRLNISMSIGEKQGDVEYTHSVVAVVPFE